MKIEIPIKILELEEFSYHILVNCMVNYNDALFVIDTGASKTVLDSNFVTENINIIDSHVESETAGIGGNTFDVQLVEVANFAMSDFTITNLHVASVDLSGVNAMYQKYCDLSISGLLGSDFLLKYKCCIDYNKLVLILDY